MAKTNVSTAIATLIVGDLGGHPVHLHKAPQRMFQGGHLQPAVVDAHRRQGTDGDIGSPWINIHRLETNVKTADGIGLAAVQPSRQHHGLVQQIR